MYGINPLVHKKYQVEEKKHIVTREKVKNKLLLYDRDWSNRSIEDGMDQLLDLYRQNMWMLFRQMFQESKNGWIGEDIWLAKVLMMS